MSVLALLTAVPLAVGFGALGAAKAAGRPEMIQRAEHVGVAASTYHVIGLLEIAGAIGVLVGLAVPVIGVGAGIGLALLMVGALAAHVRARAASPLEVLPSIVFGAVALGYVVAIVR